MHALTRGLMGAALILASAAVAGAMSLAEKAALFEHDLVERFVIDGQVMCKLRVPDEPGEPPTYNMPDNAYMTGIWLGTLSMKGEATDEDLIKSEAREALSALERLATVSGKPGLLARAAVPVDAPFDDDGIWRTDESGEWKWRGDVSSDQVTGVMFGLFWAYNTWADSRDEAIIERIASGIVDHILEHDRRIVGYDGEPTQWGNYTPDYVRETEPMNALLLLQHLKVAAWVTDDPKYEEAYSRIAFEEGYADIAREARRMSSRYGVNHSDDVLLYLAYMPLLATMHEGRERDAFIDSLQRTWEGTENVPGTKNADNPLYAMVSHFHLNRWMPGEYGDLQRGAEEVVRPLEVFPLDIKWNAGTIARYEEEFDFSFDPGIESEPPAEGEAVPYDRRPKSWSVLVQNPYETGDRSADDGMEFNGHDYLLMYWLARDLRLISSRD